MWYTFSFICYTPALTKDLVEVIVASILADIGGSGKTCIVIIHLIYMCNTLYITHYVLNKGIVIIHLLNICNVTPQFF